ncbi:MAG: hypothetical protein IPI67_34420 [Myxococcales bacterium]|nr:hypothetical protein [Myxococcales bacterium]
MSRRVRTVVGLATVAVACLAAGPASGWDVGLDAEEGWKSIYCSHVADVDVTFKQDKNDQPIENTGSMHTGDKKLLGNEHAEISDHVLWLIDPKLGQMFGTAACQSTATADVNCPRMVDLNASWLRRGIVHPAPKQGEPNPNLAGDIEKTALEERRFPPLAMWSSLPDFAYTVYDWINARRLCPPLPQDADQRKLCHVYTAWLGAGLNSTHFGHLPLRVYARHHEIALSLAVKARELRETLKAGNADIWHSEYVKELERLALAYEAAGQHFVQDRWASGHMIARWGAGSYAELPRVGGAKPKLDDAVMTGVLTGILHGSQAVFHHPDPLGAPLLDTEGPKGLLNFLLLGALPDNKGTLARWRYTHDNKFSPPTQTQACIGDYLFKPLMVSSYSGVKGVSVTPPISLASAVNQRKGMVYCGAQGFRHVIAALEKNPSTATSFGMLELPLPEPEQAELKYEWVPGALRFGQNPAEDPLCNSQWVTNESWYMGIRTIAGQTSFHEDLAVVAKVALTDPDAVYTPPALRILPAYTLARMAGMEQVLYDQAHRKRPDGSVDYGTEMARNSPTLYANGFWWKGNQNYALPEYYEPVDLDTLPDLDSVHGRDKAAVYGLFNKGAVQHWCGQSLSKDAQGATTGRLAELRAQIVSTVGDDETRKVLTAACSYLAERVHKRTDPTYDGPRSEVMGEVLPFDQSPKHGASYEPVCKLLDQSGLVATTDTKDDTRPYLLHPGYVEKAGQKGDGGHAAKSLENWCQRVPVFDVTTPPSKDRDVVYTVNATSSRWLELRGRNFGLKTPSGKLGQVLAKDSAGQWQPLDVWDEASKGEKGGWSDDGKLLYARLPPAKKGFPTTATKQMPPHQLLSLAPSAYELRLIRANDPFADRIALLSDGGETVGKYVVDVHPQVLQVKWAPVAAGTQEIRGEFCYPVWLRPHIELLYHSAFKLQAGVYTPLTSVGDQWYEDIPWQPTASVTCDPANERAGVSIMNPDPTIFDGTVVYVFAYH